MPEAIRRRAHSVREVEEILDLSHQIIYDEINSGRLRSYKVGRRRLISSDAIEEWIRDREQESAAAA